MDEAGGGGADIKLDPSEQWSLPDKLSLFMSCHVEMSVNSVNSLVMHS